MRQLWILVSFLVLLGMVFSTLDGTLGRIRGTRAVEMPELVGMVERGEVKSISMRGAAITATTTDDQRVTTVGPENSDHYVAWFSEHGVVPSFRRSEEQWVQFAAVVLPTLLMVGLAVFLFRQFQAANGRALNFGKSRARLQAQGGPKITFADVAGCDEAKQELEEIVLFLKDPHRFTRLGGRVPRGLLLMGAPGSGKTLLARAVAGEAGAPFFNLSGSEFVEMFVGVGASRVRDLFDQAKRQAPCIIFIDEIDAIGRNRGVSVGGGHEEREQTLNQLLVEMDGFEPNDAIILIAATNRPDVLDPALLRPGRFDRRVVVPPPDLRGRLGILRVHAARSPLAPDVDLERIARGTPGFSGADLASVVNEAALFAAREGKPHIETVDLDRAKDKVAMGAERRSLLLSPEDRRRTATHEAGHAIVARFVPGCDPVNKITIVPRGFALGLTESLPEERHSESRSFRLALLALLMGGRGAEEEVFGEQWTGAENDLRRATRLARSMVCESGMSEALGPVAWGLERGDDVPRFGGPDFSARTAERIDEEVRRLLDDAHATARRVIREHRAALDAVVTALLDTETLDREDFERVVRGAEPPAAP
jgi:cell division protease FtsH